MGPVGVVTGYKMTLGSSGFDQCVGPVGVATGSSGYDQWVVPVDAITGCDQWVVDIMSKRGSGL